LNGAKRFEPFDRDSGQAVWNDWNKLSWAAVRDVPNVTRQEVTVRARHRFFLEGHFHGPKAASKLLNDAFYACLELINQAVGWVRPQTPSKLNSVQSQD
jgi:hypothetical protein